MYEQDDSNSASSHSTLTITPKTTPSGDRVGHAAETQHIEQVLDWQHEGHLQSELTEPIEHEAAAVLSLMSYAAPPVARPAQEPKRSKRRGSKSHVASACVNCKKAHLACDTSRPCRRCQVLKKEDSCKDVQHKKRGRPKLQRSPKKEETNTLPPYHKVYSDNMGGFHHGDPMVITLPPPRAYMNILSPTATATSSPSAAAMGAGEHTLTLLLDAAEMCILLASPEAQEIWSISPADLQHTKIYELVADNDKEKILSLQINALRAAGFPAINRDNTADIANEYFMHKHDFHHYEPEKLALGAHGWPLGNILDQFSDSVAININGTTRQYRIRIRLGGGGYGATVHNAQSLKQAVLVVEIRKFGPF